jgi:hypothetical protein
MQRATFNKYQGSASGAVMHGKALDIENNTACQFVRSHSKSAHFEAIMSG